MHDLHIQESVINFIKECQADRIDDFFTRSAGVGVAEKRVLTVLREHNNQYVL